MSKALLIIDMLRDFIEEDGALCIGESKQVVQNISSGLKKWRAQKENQVIYIMDRHSENDAEFKMFPPHCLADTWGGEVIDAGFRHLTWQTIAIKPYGGLFFCQIFENNCCMLWYVMV